MPLVQSGWTDWPPVAGTTDIQKWNWLIQPMMAMRERGFCLGNMYYPAHSLAWADGPISSLVNNGGNSWTITDSTNAPIIGGDPDDGTYWDGNKRDPATCSSGKYWVGVNCSSGPDGGQRYFNGSYDVVIEYYNTATAEWYRFIMPWEVQRGTITDNTNNTITFTANLDNWVTAGYIPSTSSLVGCKYSIIRSSSIWWHERWPDYPNDQESWRGSADSGKMYTDGTGYLLETTNKVISNPYYQYTPLNNAWAPNKWTGKQVLVYDSSGNLKRLTVTGNSENKVFFGGLTQAVIDGRTEPSTSYTMSGDFTIVVAGNKGYPERQSQQLHWWYGGMHEGSAGHSPRDTFDGYGGVVAEDLATWYELESLYLADCTVDGERNEGMLDNDAFVIYNNECDGLTGSTADTAKAPDFHKSLRGNQVDIERMLGFFVRAQDSGGSAINYDHYTDPNFVNSYTVAECFHDAGVNAGAGSLTDSGGDQFFSVGSTYANTVIYFTVFSTSPVAYVLNGSATADGTGKVIVSSGHSEYAGYTVKWTALWTRYFPEEFTYLYACDGRFIPDLAGDPLAPVDGPEIPDFEDDGCTGVGGWEKRAVSTTTKVFNNYGQATSGSSLVNGRLYRHVGDNWNDGLWGTDDLIAPYEDHAYEGRHPKDQQPSQELSRTGVVGGGNITKFSLTDTTQNWWKNWFPGQVAPYTLRTETGEATGGSTTTLVTDDTRADSTLEEECWWNASRFSGYGSSYEGFILEVDKTETNPATSEDETVTYKFPILSTSGDYGGTNKFTVTFTAQPKKYSAGNVTIASGDTYRIKEPRYILNRYKGRRLNITKSDGTIFTVEITHSDNDTLFFAPQSFEILAGWKYQIIEYTPGKVWKYSTTAPTSTEMATLEWQKIGTNQYWIQPTGADRGSTLRKDSTHNEPIKVKAYGRMRNGDYITIDLRNEIYKVLNKLAWTKNGASWQDIFYKAGSDGRGCGDCDVDYPTQCYWSAERMFGWSVNGGTAPCNTFGTITNQDILGTNAAWDAYTPTSSSGRPYQLSNQYASALCPCDVGTCADVEHEVASLKETNYAKGTATKPVLIAGAMDFYNFGQKAAGPYDPTEVQTYDETHVSATNICEGQAPGTNFTVINSDHYISNSFTYWHQWKKWETGTPNKTSPIVTTNNCGDDSSPPTTGTMTFPLAGQENHVSQWHCINENTIVRWNVSGGLLYITWQA